MTILDRIVETKRGEVDAARAVSPVLELQATIAGLEPPRDFATAVAGGPAGEVRLIAEIKKASPSAGLIVPNFDPVAIARIYADHGAIALSVLTDETYFQGRLSYIAAVKSSVNLPVLRKDFLIDEYQVFESRAAGADAILLIAEVLDGDRLSKLSAIAIELGMGVLVEVHSSGTLAAVVDALGAPGAGGYILGINNRNLAEQRTDLSTMVGVAKDLPAGVRFVAESGIATPADMVAAADAGACAVLVGESLLRCEDIGGQVDTLLRN